MKFRLLSSLLLAALFAADTATAADLPAVYKAPPAAVVKYNWSGFYVGANVGGSGGGKCYTFVPVSGVSQDDGCHDLRGGLAGGQSGYNFQSGSHVLGVEVQGNWADVKAYHRGLSTTANVYTSRVEALATATARVGYAWKNVLLYAKGGAAFARDFFKLNTAFTPISGITEFASTTERQSRRGWVVGAGLEFGLAPNLSLAAEYNYVDLGSQDVTFPATSISTSFVERVRQSLHTGTLRVNFRIPPSSS